MSDLEGRLRIAAALDYDNPEHRVTARACLQTAADRIAVLEAEVERLTRVEAALLDLKPATSADLLTFLRFAAEHSRGHNCIVELHADDVDAVLAVVKRLTARETELEARELRAQRLLLMALNGWMWTTVEHLDIDTVRMMTRTSAPIEPEEAPLAAGEEGAA